MRLSPLDAHHRALGATFTDFAGWDMPVRYQSDLAEHRAVREHAGLFDISHMAEIRLTGSQAGAVLDYALTGRFSTLDLGQARYSLLVNPAGGVLDDVIVYRLGESEFYVIANAGNRAVVVASLTERAQGFSAQLSDETDQTALIALQGPRAAEMLDQLTGLDIEPWPETSVRSAGPAHLGQLGYYRAVRATWHSARLLIARTGYTGEDGFEIALPAHRAADLWEALLALPVAPVACGLAARDTLRLEAGMPLYGHELSPAWRPEQAGLARAVATDKPNFVGSQALAEPLSPAAPVLVGLRSAGKRAGRAGYSVCTLEADGQPGQAVGTVTSGALSPTLGYPIALAMVDPSASLPGTRLAIDVRGVPVPAEVVTVPFYRRSR